MFFFTFLKKLTRFILRKGHAFLKRLTGFILKKNRAFFKRSIFETPRRFIIYSIDDALSDFRKIKHRASVLFDYRNESHHPNLCVFACYSAKQELNKQLIHYLRKLKESGCDIILVSTAGLSDDALDTAKQHCVAAICRDNIGRDIYSYKVGIDFAKPMLPQYEKLILANDSVYGPLFDLNNLIFFGDSRALDFWGATDSDQIIYHIQSYFFVFTKRMFESSVFLNYWENLKLINHKRNIVIQYELQLTQFFMKQGFRSSVLCRYQNVINKIPEETKEHIKRKKKLKRAPCNISIQAWDYLIINHQFPFLKKELILKSPKTNVAHNFKEVMDKYAVMTDAVLEK